MACSKKICQVEIVSMKSCLNPYDLNLNLNLKGRGSYTIELDERFCQVKEKLYVSNIFYTLNATNIRDKCLIIYTDILDKNLNDILLAIPINGHKVLCNNNHAKFLLNKNHNIFYLKIKNEKDELIDYDIDLFISLGIDIC